MKDPERLFDRDDAPRALREALGLLRDQAPAPELVGYVAEQLTAAPSKALGTSLMRVKLLAWSAGAAVLAAAGLAALWTSGPAPHAVPVEVPPPPPLDPVPNPASPVVPPAVTTPANDSATRTERPPSVRAADRKHAAKSKPTSPPPSTPALTEPRAPAPSAAATAPPSAAGDTLPAQQPALHQRAADAEPQDEAGLLFRAKAAEVRDPETALRLLASHARYFPNGRYVEERDALLVRVHQRLGHGATAAELAERFRVRYPASLYRIALPE